MASEKSTPVAVVMGSDSDLKVMQSCVEQLRAFGIEPTVRILSAHRTPQAAGDFARGAEGNGIKVIVAAAGMAAHLAGAMAAWTTLPVIGVPLAAEGGPAGLDALLSTVQMPRACRLPRSRSVRPAPRTPPCSRSRSSPWLF